MGRGQNGALLWYDQDLKKAYNDRINISVQRQLPGQIVRECLVLHELRPSAL